MCNTQRPTAASLHDLPDATPRGKCLTATYSQCLCPCPSEQPPSPEQLSGNKVTMCTARPPPQNPPHTQTHTAATTHITLAGQATWLRQKCSVRSCACICSPLTHARHHQHTDHHTGRHMIRAIKPDLARIGPQLLAAAGGSQLGLCWLVILEHLAQGQLGHLACGVVWNLLYKDNVIRHLCDDNTQQQAATWNSQHQTEPGSCWQ